MPSVFIYSIHMHITFTFSSQYTRKMCRIVSMANRLYDAHVHLSLFSSARYVSVWQSATSVKYRFILMLTVSNVCNICSLFSHIYSFTVYHMNTTHGEKKTSVCSTEDRKCCILNTFESRWCASSLAPSPSLSASHVMSHSVIYI